MADDDLKKRTARAVLIAHHIEPTHDNVEHLKVMLDAVSIYDERERMYGGQWRTSGAIDNLRNARRKVSRQIAVVSSVCETTPPTLSAGNLDDAIDGLNYLAFFIRNARLINFDGAWEE